MLASALDRTASLTVDPAFGAGPLELRVRLERAEGGSAAPAYLATIQLAPALAPATSAGASPDQVAAGLGLLSQHGVVAYFDLDLRENRVLLTPSWKKLLGYAAAELPDTVEAWRGLFHPDDTGAAPDRVGRRVAVGPRTFHSEFRLKHRRGHWVWIQCLGLQLVGAPGQVDRVYGLHLDISERKEVEEALVANDARLQDLSGAGPLAAFELDFTQAHFWFSPAWEKLLGYPEGELPGAVASFAAALPPEEASAGVTEWLLARAPGQTSGVEPIKLRARDGKPVPVLLGWHRSVSRKRELLRIVGFACPIPAGAGATEGALPAAVALAAFDTLAEAVLVTDANRRILFANATAARLLGVDAPAVLGQPAGDVFRLVNRLSGRPAEDPIDQAMAADSPLAIITTDALAPADSTGAPTPVAWIARIAEGPGGIPLGVIVFRNPTELTLTPDELIKSNRFESLGHLASGIAHDFNNLLTTILGAISLGLEQADYSSLSDAEKACLTAQGLTKQLLAFARGGSGTRVVCEPQALIEHALKIGAAASAATVTKHFAEPLANIRVDRAQMLQVFQNLIVNALQAMPPPPHRPALEIDVRTLSVTSGQVEGLVAGEYVEFEIRDNGSGIKQEHVGKIFDPFFTTKKHGTGLGLATVMRIVNRHGGQIALATEVGVGTAFTVYLPQADAEVELAPRRAAIMPYERTNRVLFMDDDAEIRRFTVALLAGLGYECDEAPNGETALMLFRKWVNLGKPHYDAVIMDLTVVGGMGGEECFAKLRELDPNVRGIVASGYDNDDMRHEFFAKGFLGYLTKPYRKQDLGKVLKDVIG